MAFTHSKYNGADFFLLSTMPSVSMEKQSVPHAAKAWDFFRWAKARLIADKLLKLHLTCMMSRSMGSPKFHVAPMVDQVYV